MNHKEIIRTLKKYEANSSMHPMETVWDKAVGEFVYDNGKRYIDFTSGIFVANVGHSKISKYLIDQIDRGLIFSYCYPTEIRARLCKKLIEITPKYLEKVVLTTTGGEAVEMALRLMRLAQNRRSTVLSIRGSMHGKSLLGTALKDKNKVIFADCAVGNLPFPDKFNNFEDDLYAHILKYDPMFLKNEEIGGIIIESYQGYSARFLPIKWVQDMEKWAKKNKILICFDEVQGGFWRTGKLFAYEHYGIKPDLVTIGKGFGGGVPISGVLGKSKLLDLGKDLTSTYSGNPLCCAGALGNIIELNKLDKQELKAKENILAYYLNKFKEKYNSVIEVNYKGLLGAIICENEQMATYICKKALKEGVLLVHTGRESIKIGPPLTISKESLIEGLNKIEKVMKCVGNICFV